MLMGMPRIVAASIAFFHVTRDCVGGEIETKCRVVEIRIEEKYGVD